MPADLLIRHATLVTCASNGKPKRDAAMRDVGIVHDGAVAIQDGQIISVGSTAELDHYAACEHLDVDGKVVCPGFVDCHTHLVYGGDRIHEFELRIGGANYMDILEAGGGILSTMRATREADHRTLFEAAYARLDAMKRLGTTTVEAKTGYGLNTSTELKTLKVLAELDRNHSVDLVPTFLGAHAVPPEYRPQTDAYVDVVVREMIPAVAQWYTESEFKTRNIPFFVDVFCEQNVFDVDQARRVLEAGITYGLTPKAHVDEFVSLGGVTMAVDLESVSVDHLDVTGDAEIGYLAQSDTTAVIMPAVNFHLGSTHFANARKMLDAGVIVALATDLNPGSAPCLSMPFIMAIACRYQRFLPSEALNASTINAAYAIGLGERIGSIEVGKQADLLILDTDDYRTIAYQLGGNPVKQVIKRGKL